MVWKMMRNFVLGNVVSIATIGLPSLAVAAPPDDACALLTQGQAGAALGGTVDAGKPVTRQTCRWGQQGKAGDTLLKLDVTVMTADRFAHMKAVTVGTVTSVGGLGDDAFYATLKTANTTLTTLNIKKGDAAVTIRVSGGSKPAEEYQAKEKAAAQALLPKL